MSQGSEDDLDQSMEEKPVKQSISPKGKPRPVTSIDEKKKDSIEQSEESEDEDDEDNEGMEIEGAYNSSDYEHLAVSSEVKELFLYINRYTPQPIELEYKLKPFIPDFIPAVGDIDAFIKAPRPDNKSDLLGLTVLDEPCAKQSDPAILDLQLRAVSKQSSTRAVSVKILEHPEKNTREIDNWIKSISDLHRSKPPPAVHYSRNMPDMDTLMQEWSPEVEEALKEVLLPTADLDCSLEEYIQIICAVLDIPVYKSYVQSLHVIFSLYLNFKKHQHFQENIGELKPGDGDIAHGVDRLVLQ